MDSVWFGLLSATAMLFSIASIIVAWWNRSSAKTADHERRIQSIEGEMKHLPNKEDVSELKLGMATMNGRMNTIDAEMGSISRTTRRIEDHLLKGDA